MLNLLFIVITLILMYTFENKYLKKDNFWLVLFPIVCMFILIYSLQYSVGTDYESYLISATNSPEGQVKFNITMSDYEYLSALIMYVTKSFFNPQMIFFFFSSIQVFSLFLILKKLYKKGYNLTLVVFLYFFVSSNFFTSFNAVRQCTAVPLFVLSIIYILENNIKTSFVFFLLSCLFHQSSFYLFPLHLLIYFVKNKNIVIGKKFLLIGFILVSLLYFFDVNSLINILLKSLPSFSNLLNSGFVEKMAPINIVTRILKIIPLFYCVYKLNIQTLSKNQKLALNLSYVSVLVVALSFSSTIIVRVSSFFDLFLIIPFLLFFKQDGNVKEKKYVIFWLILMLLVKLILFPSNEYLYDSIIFKK